MADRIQKGDSGPVGSCVEDHRSAVRDGSAAFREVERHFGPLKQKARVVILRSATLGLAQEQAAKRMGTAEAVISRIESGQHCTKHRHASPAHRSALWPRRSRLCGRFGANDPTRINSALSPGSVRAHSADCEVVAAGLAAQPQQPPESWPRSGVATPGLPYLGISLPATRTSLYETPPSPAGVSRSLGRDRIGGPRRRGFLNATSLSPCRLVKPGGHSASER